MHENQVPPLDEQLCFALYAATNAVVRTYRPLLDEVGLTYPQYLVMLILWREDLPLGVTELGDRLQLPAHALSPLLDRMEANGLIRKRRSTSDRRRVDVLLTEAGVELEEAVAHIQKQVVCATTLESQERDEMRAKLHDLVDRMTRAEQQPSGR